jgi:CDGSH-type Zn-finger protein
MSKMPEIGGREPIFVEVTAGETYWWCACGRSKEQPFCGGLPEGSGFELMEWTATHTGRVKFCTCKRTKSQPICDYSHLKL